MPDSTSLGLSDLPADLADLLMRAARIWPDRAALTLGSTQWSYATLLARAQAWACQWQAAGLRRGQRVGVWLDKRLEGVAAMVGVMMAGGVLVPINPVLKPVQVRHILEDCDAWGLLTLDLRWSASGELSATGVRVVALLSAQAEDSALHWMTLPLGARDGQFMPAKQNADVPEALALIFYTSGSTGLPKGVMVSHANLVAGAVSVSTYLQLQSEDVILAVLPLSFDAGFSQLTTSWWSGSHVVLLNHLFAQDVIAALDRHRVTGITAVPPLYAQLADVDWPADSGASLRFWANTGGRMPEPVLRSLQARLPHAAPILMYGLTEAFRSTYLPPEELSIRPDSIGRAIPWASVHVVDSTGRECPPGDVGELVHCGPLVTLGYWRRPEDQAIRFRPWPLEGQDVAVFSGDLVRQDRDGFLYFVGRNDEMIKTSGYRVSPTEVEQLAMGSGLVGEVVAVGLDDARLGQKICVALTPARDAVEDDSARTQALLAHFRQHAPPYLCPRHVHWVSGSMPRTPNGKLERTFWRSHAWI